MDLPKLPPFFGSRLPLRHNLLITYVTGRCFAEVRRGTQPRISVVSLESLDRIHRYHH